jgi:L-fuconolactonase
MIVRRRNGTTDLPPPSAFIFATDDLETSLMTTPAAPAATPATVSPGYPVRLDWLARNREPVLEPDLVIVDPHHHLWHRAGTFDQAGDQSAHYLFPDLLADMNCGHDVRATVFVQCRSMYRQSGPEAMRSVGEVEFVNGVAAQSATGFYGPRLACAGIVAGADLTLGAAVEPVLQRMRAVAGERFVGIRNTVAWHASPDVRSSSVLPPPGLMADPRFRDGVGRLAAHDLSLDIWAYQTQAAEVLDLARAHPGVIMVIDHLGGPVGAGPYAGKRDDLFADWQAGIAALARLPNTRIKLGGLGMKVGGFAFHQAAEPPTSQQLAEAWKPYVDTAIELFGPSRAMFESNFPVCKGMFGASVFWNACKRLSAGYSPSEKAALFSGTAAAVYRLPAAEIGV